MTLRERAKSFFFELQDTICAALEDLDGAARFHEDQWTHAPGEGPGEGGGRTRVLAGGKLLEKGGVNVSSVKGDLSPRLAKRLAVPPSRFFATGLSLVLHPESPLIPTVHMNVRFLQVFNSEGDGDGGVRRAWFGGGSDLTPYYLFEEDAVHFHRTLKSACDRHDPEYYPRFKKECDDYFYLPHRREARGIGGIFFDYLDQDLEQAFGFVRDVGGAFLDAYTPIVERRAGEPFTEQQRVWQQHRRGRYVEFNLLHDRGTVFGLETGGRTESILISLPPTVRWSYDYKPAGGTPEATLLDALQKPRTWVD